MCDACQTRRSIPKPVCGKPIVSIGFLNRLQVDLIHMRSVEYNGYKFILHAKDHFTKFSWLNALPSKQAYHVAATLRNIFLQFGPPKILQSDNGKEFVAKIILELKSSWPDLIIINGRPRHPQSQGLVERGNAVVQKMLGKWQETNKSNDWPNGLVMLSINNCVSQSAQKTPYEMVFGQPTRSDHDFWQQLNKQYSNNLVVNEEDLPQSIANMISSNDDESTINQSTDVCSSSTIPSLSLNTHTTKIIDNKTETSHKQIRDEAEKNYIRTAGLKISEVDRSNTSPSILPCKIIDISYRDESSDLQYKLATLDGKINDWFLSLDLIDLSDTLSTELRQLDTNNLPDISFIQACQAFTKFKSINTCKCTGSCDTNRCSCKKRSLLCCTKCHRGKCVSCKNNN
ncbi:unnamed protein product [Rotaria sordida]|uniref:Integrase catalytic domain-containing protein n=1 Tax=Rotaria sordida TaxID=392033 RepID=A0A815X278_9BILA|nr:unnamed protein product [Rotaria sordida]CAF1551106.1 unnamed protein product [Rotaria sordida]